MANKASDWLLYGGLALSGAGATLGLVGVSIALVTTLAGFSAVGITIGSVMKLMDK